MRRIEATFEKLKQENRKAVIMFLTAGDPSLSVTEKLVPELFSAGADIVEIGIPFSDPLADGPTIQASFNRALAKGVNLKDILATTAKIRRKTDKPIVFMSAYNLIYRYGLKKFAKDAAKAGVDGVILPDLIPEEAETARAELQAKGIDTIFLAAPTSGPDRIKKITASSTGFVYYISVKGITGSQKPDLKEVKSQVNLIKKASGLPVGCGFGITTPQDAAEFGKVADGVIIGSALVKILTTKGKIGDKISSISKFVREVRHAVDNAR